MARLLKQPKTVLNAVTSTGFGTAINVKDYRHIVLQFGTTGSANCTVKFAGSVSEESPTFSSAASPTNHWDYVAVYDYEDAAKIDGDTGIALTGSDDIRTLQVNTDGLSYFNAQVSARSAGAITVKVVGFND
jgi:hypothetical protein